MMVRAPRYRDVTAVHHDCDAAAASSSTTAFDAYSSRRMRRQLRGGRVYSLQREAL